MNVNCAAAATQSVPVHILFVAADCFDNWRPAVTPFALMLELVLSVFRFILVAAASVVLALYGILVSVLAYVRDQYGTMRRKGDAHVKLRSPSYLLPPLPIDRGVPLSPGLKPRGQRSLHKKSSLSASSFEPVSGTSHSTPGIPPLPFDPHRAHSRKSSQHRHHRTVQAAIEGTMPSIDAAVEAVGGRATIAVLVTPDSVHAIQDARQHHRESLSESPSPVYSDSSSNLFSNPSVSSLSPEEQSSMAGRGVLQKIRERHVNLRERCVTRAKSMPLPIKQTAQPARRTNPYQAPFFFPTPMSPQAGTYLQEVISERQGLNPPVDEPIFSEQTTFPSPLLSPKPVLSAEPSATSSRPQTPASHLPNVNEDSQPPPKQHRWSWHIPRRAHPHRARSDDVHAQSHDRTVKDPTPEHREGLHKFKFGHHKRRREVDRQTAS